MGYQLASIGDFSVGQQASFSKTITEADIANFVAVSGDVNPLHIDEEFSKRTFFGQRVAHGILSASLLSTVIGMILPGTGAIYRSQTLEFLKPVHIGDTLTAFCEVEVVDKEQELLHMRSWVENQGEETVLRGRSEVGLIRKLKG